MAKSRRGLIARVGLGITIALFVTSCTDDHADSSKGAPSGPSTPPAKVGQSIPARLSGSGNATDIGIVVDQVRCGIDSIDQNSGPLEVPDGYRYCEADLEVTNTGGGTTGKLTFTGTMNGEDGASYASDPDATKAAGAVITTLNTKFYGTPETPPLAAGQKAETAVVWAMPIGIGPTGMTLAGPGVTSVAAQPALGPITVAAGDIQWQSPKGE